MAMIVAMVWMRRWSPWRKERPVEHDWWVPATLFGCIAFLISAYYGIGEIRYLLFAHRTEGTVVRTFLETHRTRSYRRRHHRVVEYSFQDEGQSRRERDWVPVSWAAPQGKVAIEYIPGRHSSRVAGNHSYLSLVCFVVTLSFASFGLVRVWRESAEPPRSRDDDAPVRRRKVKRRQDAWEKIPR